MMNALSVLFEFYHCNSMPYKPKMIGAVEATNRNVKKILQKMTETYRDGLKRFYLPCLPTGLPFVLNWGNKLVYVMDAV